MDRLATGIVIAMAALVFSGGLASDSFAEAPSGKAPDPAPAIQSPAPVVHGPRSERVLSLLLTLEALRAAPVLLDAGK